jgi:hypothetical protein
MRLSPEVVREVEKRGDKLLLPAPTMAELADIVTAEGEERDRLFTLAVRKQSAIAIHRVMDEIEAEHIMNCPDCGNKGNMN